MTDKENPTFVERFTVRMPDGLRYAIAERAKQNGRSMNSEIVQILQDALSEEGISDNTILDVAITNVADTRKALKPIIDQLKKLAGE